MKTDKNTNDETVLWVSPSPNLAKGAKVAVQIASIMAGAGLGALPIAFLAALIAGSAMGYISVYSLGMWLTGGSYDQALNAWAGGNSFGSHLAAATMIGSVLSMAAFVGLGGVMKTQVGAPFIDYLPRGAALIFFTLWSVLTVCIVVLERLVSSERFGISYNSLPGELAAAGEFTYLIAPAINILPVIIVALIVGTAPRGKYHSLWTAVGGVLWTMGKGIAGLAAGFLAEVFFGLANNIPALYVVPAALLMSFGFMSALAQYDDAHRRRDKFDMRVWSTFGVVFLIYVTLVTFKAVETLRFVGTLGADVNQAAEITKHFDGDWLHRTALDMYYASVPAFTVIFALALFLTKRIDRIETEGEVKPEYKVINPNDTWAYKVGGLIGTARNWREDFQRGSAGVRQLSAPQNEPVPQPMSAEKPIEAELNPKE